MEVDGLVPAGRLTPNGADTPNVLCDRVTVARGSFGTLVTINGVLWTDATNGVRSSHGTGVFNEGIQRSH